jgi:hypothetical protein
MKKPEWLDLPEDHDYPAALSYLLLVMSPEEAAATVAALRDAPVSHFKAKDICRASGLPLLGPENAHVAKNLNKVQSGKRLSPVLLVRGAPMIIADGYHRTCSVHHLDEDAVVPCKIA